MMRAVVLVAALAGTADANVWQRAIERTEASASQDVYDDLIREGDEKALQANAKGVAPKLVRSLVERAATSYRNASATRPQDPEAYYRVGSLLYSFYFDCNAQVQLAHIASPICIDDPTVFDRKRAQEIIDAWNAFEARAPLDPRLGVVLGEAEILFARAVLETKLADKPHLEAAAKDYEKILSREDTGVDGVGEVVLSNLAETYMMLDRLDEAIDTYREAVRGASDTSTWYGLAVALDRDERSDAALDVMRALGRAEMDQFHQRVAAGRTFFVPRGEEYYYFALSDEAFGIDDEAIEYWQKYIASGAHPEFQPRARAHLTGLLGKQKRRRIPLEPPWSGILR